MYYIVKQMCLEGLIRTQVVEWSSIVRCSAMRSQIPTRRVGGEFHEELRSSIAKCNCTRICNILRPYINACVFCIMQFCRISTTYQHLCPRVRLSALCTISSVSHKFKWAGSLFLAASHFKCIQLTAGRTRVFLDICQYFVHVCWSLVSE